MIRQTYCPRVVAGLAGFSLKDRESLYLGKGSINTLHGHLNLYSTAVQCNLVEGNSRFCEVALGIPTIPGNSHRFPGIPGGFGNRESKSVAGAHERTPPNGELRSTTRSSSEPSVGCAKCDTERGKAHDLTIPVAIITGPKWSHSAPLLFWFEAASKEF